ncbi:hypothetical protein ACFL4S_00465 [bacterium]
MNKEEKELKENKVFLKHASDWFYYHAKQRLVTFRFFLLLLIAIGYLYVNMFDKCSINCLRLGCGILLLILSLLFFILELRNRELVNCGREALDELEKRMCMYDVSEFDKIKPDAYGFAVRLRDEKRKCLKCCDCLITHKFVFGIIFFLVGLLGLSMILYSSLGICC